jgi:predicted AlkP superfamily phosphohydrolase/phosphomutase
VYLNRWLWEKDYLKFTQPFPQSLKGKHPASKAFALYPGRIFINLKGREKTGSVDPGLEYEALKEKLKQELKQLSDPQTGEPIIDSFFPEPQSFLSPNSKNLADIVAIAHEGYDLKGVLWNKELFSKTVYNGMHTFDNAFVLFTGPPIEKENLAITDLKEIILNAF